MKIVFVAGPYRGDCSEENKINNIEIARKHIRNLIEANIPYYSPHLNINQELVKDGNDYTKLAFSINQTILEKCNVLAVLPGWKQSSGTIAEIEYAKRNSLPIVYLENNTAIEDLKKLYKKN